MSGLLERCRLCMERYSSPAALRNIFLDGAVTVETIRIVTQIEVVEGDGLPPYACQLCIYQLKNAKNFIQSCIDCNKKLKLLYMVQATISTACEGSQSSVFGSETSCEALSTGPPHSIESESLPVTETLPPVFTPAACFPVQPKTEPSSPHETESGSQMIGKETYVQSARDITEGCLKPKEENNIVNETDAANIYRSAQDNTEDCLESKEENNIVDETDAADIARFQEINEFSQEAEERSSVELSRDNNLQIKTEQIAVDEYFDDEPLLLAAADEAGVPDMKPINISVFTTHQETAGIGLEREDPILTEVNPLNKASSASCRQLLPTTTQLPAVGQDSCTENVAAVEQDMRAQNMAATLANDSGRLVGSKPTLMRCQSGPRRLLRSLSRKRKRGLQCRKCLHIFPRLSLLLQHVCDLTESSNPFDCRRMFECGDCSAGFSSHASLEIHQKQHTRNYNRYCKVGLDSQYSDFDINSSDSENSIFKCPDSEDSIRDLKSSDSEGSNLKACLDSEDYVLQSNSDSDSCEMDTISLESDSSVFRSNSDLGDPEIDTSFESDGSGLRPNSDSERSCKNSSTDSEDSATKSEDLDSNPVLQTADSPTYIVDFGHGSVTSSPNAGSQKNTENESLVCTRPTLTLQSTTSLRNKSEQSLRFTANLDCLSENSGTGTLPFLRSGRGNCLSKRKRYIQDDDADNKHQRKRRRQISSELRSQEEFRESGSVKLSKGKGKLPFVQPGESHRVLASVSPVCARTRSRILSEGVSDDDLGVGLQPNLDVFNGKAKKSVVGTEKELEYVNQCEVVKQKNRTNCKVNGKEIGNHNDQDLPNSGGGKKQEEKIPKARERNGLKQNTEVISKGLLQKKGNSKEEVQDYEILKNSAQYKTTTKRAELIMSKGRIEKISELTMNGRELSTVLFNSEKKSMAKISEDNAESGRATPSKKTTEIVKVGNMNRNNNMSRRRSMIENGRGSTARDPLSPAVGILEKASTKRRSLCSAAPEMSFRCWKCGREFACSSKLIKHFSRHLQAML